jgi:hypothetical protein
VCREEPSSPAVQEEIISLRLIFGSLPLQSWGPCYGVFLGFKSQQQAWEAMSDVLVVRGEGRVQVF